MVRYILKIYNNDNLDLDFDWKKCLIDFFQIYYLNNIKTNITQHIFETDINKIIYSNIQNLLDEKIVESSDYFDIFYIIIYILSKNFKNYKFIFYKEFENIVYKFTFDSNINVYILNIDNLKYLNNSKNPISSLYMLKYNTSDILEQICMLKEVDYKFENLCKYYKY